MNQLHLGIAGQQADIGTGRETQGCSTTESITPVTGYSLVRNNRLRSLPVGIPIVLVFLLYPIHVDGKVAIPVRAFFHMGQTGEIGYQQTVVPERGKRDDPFYHESLFPGIEVFQVLCNEVTHAYRVTLYGVKPLGGIIGQNHLLPLQALVLPFADRSHKGIVES